MGFNFKWYRPSIGTPIVSLAEYGITFNRAAAEEMSLPEKIQLGFDEDLKIIGVRPIHNWQEDDKDLLQFAGKERVGFTRINNKDFIRFISRFCPEMKFERASRYLAKWDENLGVLIVDLKNPLEGSISENESEEQEPE